MFAGTYLVFLLRAPTTQQQDAFVRQQARAPFSYPEVGATRHEVAPAGYAVDRWQRDLGTGPEVFARARAALRSWRMFGGPLVRLVNPHASWAPGETLALHIAHFGAHSLVANRVVYVIDEPGRCGFAYGTLTGHAEQGEERFLLECLPDGRVRFGLFAFSRPRAPLARLGAPLVRVLQRRAAQEYLGALASAAQDA